MKSRAFTLIELLVVVLIIGILAAIALPQYQVAVTKARLSTYMPMAKALVQAEDAYYLANGTYTADLAALDIEIPHEGYTYVPGTTASYYKNEETGVVYGVYDGPANVQAGDSDIRYLEYFIDSNSHRSAKKGERWCFAKSSIAIQVCRSFGGTEKPNTGGGWKAYLLTN